MWINIHYLIENVLPSAFKHRSQSRDWNFEHWFWNSQGNSRTFCDTELFWLLEKINSMTLKNGPLRFLCLMAMRLSNGVRQSNQIFNIYIQQFRVACSHFVDMVFYKLGHFFVIFFFFNILFSLDYRFNSTKHPPSQSWRLFISSSVGLCF